MHCKVVKNKHQNRRVDATYGDLVPRLTPEFSAAGLDGIGGIYRKGMRSQGRRCRRGRRDRRLGEAVGNWSPYGFIHPRDLIPPQGLFLPYGHIHPAVSSD